MSHNDYLFRKEGAQFCFLRQFEDMYRNCDDPHGQSKELNRLDYQIALLVLDRAITATTEQTVRILDIGCGLGYFTAHVKKAFPNARVSGCDMSETAIEKARELAPECRFFAIDLKRPAPLPDGEYDVLLALHVLCYFTDQEIHEVIGNLNRLLPAGGFVLVGHHLPKTMNFGRYMQNLADARTLFSSHGFEMRLGLDMTNDLDKTYSGDAVGRNIYFLVEKQRPA